MADRQRIILSNVSFTKEGLVVNKGEFSKKLVFVILFSILTSKSNSKATRYIQIKASEIYSKITDSLESDYIILNKTEKRYLKNEIIELMGGNKKISNNKQTKKFINNMINFFTGDIYE